MVRRHGRGVLWAGGNPCMTGCLEYPLARPVSRKVKVRPLLMEPGTRQRHSLAAVTDHDVYAFKGLVVPSPKLGVQRRSNPPLEQQPPRGARRKCGARPLSTANVAVGINSLICLTSIEHSASTYVVHGQRSAGRSPA